jgi:hypothetical protein
MKTETGEHKSSCVFIALDEKAFFGQYSATQNPSGWTEGILEFMINPLNSQRKWLKQITSNICNSQPNIQNFISLATEDTS